MAFANQTFVTIFSMIVVAKNIYGIMMTHAKKVLNTPKVVRQVVDFVLMSVKMWVSVI